MKSDPVSLVANTHKGLRVSQSSSAEHIKENHIAKVYAQEYLKAAAEYPILFLKDPHGNGLISVVMWGITPGENLFVKDDKWVGGYVPASVRCFPFTMSTNPEFKDRLFFGVYEDSLLLNKEEGELMFNEDGSETEWMGKTKEFLSHVYFEEESTKKFLENIEALGLLAPQSLSIKLSEDGQEQNIDGFFVVDRAKLAELADDEFLKLRKSGMLEPIYAHLASLDNIQKLIRLKTSQ